MVIGRADEFFSVSDVSVEFLASGGVSTLIFDFSLCEEECEEDGLSSACEVVGVKK
jgi:hypothetical protein